MRRDCRLLLGKTAGGSPGLVSIKSTVATVAVHNRHGSDLRVWVMATDGSSYRLGIVPKLGAATLELPSMTRPPAEVRFVAVPFGIDDPPMPEPIIANFAMRLIYTVAHEPSSWTLGKQP
jgi:hypothetical protein